VPFTFESERKIASGASHSDVFLIPARVREISAVAKTVGWGKIDYCCDLRVCLITFNPSDMLALSLLSFPFLFI